MTGSEWRANPRCRNARNRPRIARVQAYNAIPCENVRGDFAVADWPALGADRRGPDAEYVPLYMVSRRAHAAALAARCAVHSEVYPACCGRSDPVAAGHCPCDIPPGTPLWESVPVALEMGDHSRAGQVGQIDRDAERFRVAHRGGAGHAHRSGILPACVSRKGGAGRAHYNEKVPGRACHRGGAGHAHWSGILPDDPGDCRMPGVDCIARV